MKCNHIWTAYDINNPIKLKCVNCNAFSIANPTIPHGLYSRTVEEIENGRFKTKVSTKFA